MRQNNPANLRALVAAVVVVSFVVISSYIAFGTSSSKNLKSKSRFGSRFSSGSLTKFDDLFLCDRNRPINYNNFDTKRDRSTDPGAPNTRGFRE